MDKESVLTGLRYLPIVGQGAIGFIRKNKGTSFSLTRQPQKAGIAQSNALGYSNGVYTLGTK